MLLSYSLTLSLCVCVCVFVCVRVCVVIQDILSALDAWTRAHTHTRDTHTRAIHAIHSLRMGAGVLHAVHLCAAVFPLVPSSRETTHVARRHIHRHAHKRRETERDRERDRERESVCVSVCGGCVYGMFVCGVMCVCMCVWRLRPARLGVCVLPSHTHTHTPIPPLQVGDLHLFPPAIRHPQQTLLPKKMVSTCTVHS